MSTTKSPSIIHLADKVAHRETKIAPSVRHATLIKISDPKNVNTILAFIKSLNHKRDFIG